MLSLIFHYLDPLKVEEPIEGLVPLRSLKHVSLSTSEIMHSLDGHGSISLFRAKCSPDGLTEPSLSASVVGFCGVAVPPRCFSSILWQRPIVRKQLPGLMVRTGTVM